MASATEMTKTAMECDEDGDATDAVGGNHTASSDDFFSETAGVPAIPSKWGVRPLPRTSGPWASERAAESLLSG